MNLVKIAQTHFVLFGASTINETATRHLPESSSLPHILARGTGKTDSRAGTTPLWNTAEHLFQNRQRKSPPKLRDKDAC